MLSSKLDSIFISFSLVIAANFALIMFILKNYHDKDIE
jgi:hypothetical protein